MKLLVLGGTGWLGHRIANVLAEKKLDVTIVSRGKFQDFTGNVAGIRTITADKNDEKSMREIFETRYTHVIDSVPSADSIAWVVKYGSAVRHYIHCSSTGGYTPLPFIPCDETVPYRGFRSGTGWDLKRVVDNMVMEIFREKGFPATVLRPSYITGPGKLPLDNLGGRRKDFISDIIAEKVLDLPDNGEALLHPVYVDDLANAFYLALVHPENSIGQIYNISLNHAVTLNRYLEITAAAFNKRSHINYMSVDEMLAKYAGNINETGLRFLACHMCFSIAKAQRDLEYTPSRTTEEAIEENALWAAGIL